MPHPAYNVKYSVVPTNSSLFTIKWNYSVITTHVYNDTNFSLRDVTKDFDSNYLKNFLRKAIESSCDESKRLFRQ